MKAMVVSAATLFTLLIAPDRGRAQGKWDFRPRVTLEAYGGVSTFGRFLEQEFDDGERELTASSALAVGGSIGIWPWAKTGVRAAFTVSPTEFEFEDDTGTDTDRPRCGGPR